jgi:hypothetical protein
MTVPCNRPYAKNPLDRAYVASRLGLGEYIVNVRLHKLKRIASLRGDDSVVIYLGLVREQATRVAGAWERDSRHRRQTIVLRDD